LGSFTFQLVPLPYVKCHVPLELHFVKFSSFLAFLFSRSGAALLLLLAVVY